MNRLPISLACLAAILTITPCALFAQGDSLVAVGHVNNFTTVVNSTNTVGGTISVTDNGTGDRNLTISAPGAFVGAHVLDFVLDLTKRTSDSDDYVSGVIFSVTDDELVCRIRSVDLEDDTVENAQEDRYVAFNFLIRRGNRTAQTVSPATSHLIALAFIDSTGTPDAVFGVDGIEVTSSGSGGDYAILLEKPGYFQGDAGNDYVVFAQAQNIGLADELAGHSSTSTVSDDSVTISVDVYDVQSASNADTGTQVADNFCVAIYRIPSGPDNTPPASRLLFGSANIASSGSLSSGFTSVPHGVVSSANSGDGNYVVDFNAYGEFEGKSTDQYFATAKIRTVSSTDHLIQANAALLSDHTLRVFISIAGVERTGQITGIPENDAFSVTVYDLGATFQPDMQIGTKRSLTSMRGNNVYNSIGAGQTIRVSLNGTGPERYYFAAQNDGTSIDNFSILEIGAGKTLRSKYFRLTGGRANVTAAIRRGLVAAPAVAPGRTVLFQADTRYRSANSTKKRKVRLAGKSSYDTASDTARAKIQPGK